MQSKILIVDDVLENLRVLSNTLSQKNFEVRCTKNGALALHGARIFLPDLILLDIKMPDISGFEVCQRLKADEKTRDIPIIFLSALNDAEDKVKAFSVGGVDYITKPFHIEEVLARIEHQIALQTARKEIVKLNAELENRVRERTAELESMNRELQREIADRKRVEAQLIHDTLHDALTHLPNRVLFMERVELALERIKQNKGYLFAILFIDLDRFKVVNDSLGHIVGDQLLVAIANLLKQCLRSVDVVARLGGDEFTILLDGIDSLSDAIHVAERVQTALTSPFELDNHTVFTSASIGIVLGSVTYHSAIELLRDADIATYRAKSNGKARYTVFDQEMYEKTLELLQLENDLRQVHERQELFINYQPIISLLTGELIGFEALLRWQHPTRHLVSPGTFIPIAEETGLIISIGNWVLHQACQHFADWRAKFHYAQHLKLHVNLATQQLMHPDFLQQVDWILQDTGMDGNYLSLEITESTLIDHSDQTINLLHQLRQYGIQFSIDDFGKGYSSLCYLYRLPIDNLKIDRSFINLMNTDSENFEIVRAIITLAHTLRLAVIAEGVEATEQLTQLRRLGCDAVQGYLFSKSLDPIIVETLIINPKPWLDLENLKLRQFKSEAHHHLAVSEIPHEEYDGLMTFLIDN